MKMKHVLFGSLILLVMIGACNFRDGTLPKSNNTFSAMVAPTSKLLDRAEGSRPHEGDPAPDFSYTMADETTQRLSDLRGKKVLLNFWATWCTPCKIEMPEMQQALKKYGPEGLVILAVSNEEAEIVDAFARKYMFTFLLIANQENDIGRGYGVTGFPVSFFINSDGSINFKQVGVMNRELLTQHIEDLR